jgi:hypothetical protein
MFGPESEFAQESGSYVKPFYYTTRGRQEVVVMDISDELKTIRAGGVFFNSDIADAVIGELEKIGYDVLKVKNKEAEKEVERIMWIKQRIRDGEKYANSTLFGDHYYDMKHMGALDTPLGKEVAQKYYDSLIVDGKYFVDKWHFEEAKKVAEEAELGQPLVDKAQRDMPGIFRRMVHDLTGW